MQLLKIVELQRAIEAMLNNAAKRVSKRRKNSIKAHNKKANRQSANFSIGAVVLVRSEGKK